MSLCSIKSIIVFLLSKVLDAWSACFGVELPIVNNVRRKHVIRILLRILLALELTCSPLFPLLESSFWFLGCLLSGWTQYLGTCIRERRMVRTRIVAPCGELWVCIIDRSWIVLSFLRIIVLTAHAQSFHSPESQVLLLRIACLWDPQEPIRDVQRLADNLLLNLHTTRTCDLGKVDFISGRHNNGLFPTVANIAQHFTVIIIPSTAQHHLLWSMSLLILLTIIACLFRIASIQPVVWQFTTPISWWTFLVTR